MRTSRWIRGVVTAAAVLAAIAGAAPAAWAQNSPDETAPSNRFTAAPDSGVIKPPAGEDPGLRKPPPANGSTMRVIPPPGTPGNSGTIVPK